MSGDFNACGGGEKLQYGMLTGAMGLGNRYLPAIGRFLIVVTFLEDAIRIITQWNDQLMYLNEYRRSGCSRLYCNAIELSYDTKNNTD